MNLDTLIERLTSIVGGEHVLVDPALCARYEIDLTRRWSGRALAVVRPADVSGVAAVLATCHAAGAPVVPQGGHTGMVGGATPRDGEVVLSLERLDWLGEVDTFERSILVGAGATLEMVQDLAQHHGLFLPIDLGARGTATIGGMTATNAGGAKAIRYGTMSEHVVGLEAVLPDGRIVDRSNPLRKDNAGFAWHKLVPGTEGTLCVITSVRLRLMPSLPRTGTALCGLESVAAGVELCRALQMLAPDLEAVDFFD